MHYITNPVLTGFNPDPSIIREGDDYYIATSTFEWFPGVQIHHSNDLVHWRLLTRPLSRVSQLDMRGNPASGGIWAPCLSYDNGTFYLIYTDVKTKNSIFKDTHNYLVTTDDITGEWSEPVYLNSSGFDPSHFHDDDGRKWLVNISWDYREGHNSFEEIYLQEYSENPVLTSRYDATLPLQKAGHADVVETQNGEWYMVHLCGRPIPSRGRCVLGRETSIQKVKWTEDGWLRLETGGNTPETQVPAPDLPERAWEPATGRDDFDSNELDINFQSLRVPAGDNYSLSERKGSLRLYGDESTSSRHNPVLIARRQKDFCYTAETCVEFEPETYKQMAGLICFYDTERFFYLSVSHHDDIGKCLCMLTCDNGNFDFPMRDGADWKEIDCELDYSILADEYGGMGFTGAFIGVTCQDLEGKRRYADFDYFDYIPRELKD